MGIAYPLSVSIGVCYNDKQAVKLKHLFKHADTALYEAKKNRGTIVDKQLQQLLI